MNKNDTFPDTNLNLQPVAETPEIVWDRERDAAIAARFWDLNQVNEVVNALMERTIESPKYLH